jgi:hypothetical protein
MGEPLRFIPLSDGRIRQATPVPRTGQGMLRLRCSSLEVYCETELLSRPLSCQFRSKLTSHCNIAYRLMGFVDEFEGCALKPAHRALRSRTSATSTLCVRGLTLGSDRWLRPLPELSSAVWRLSNRAFSRTSACASTSHTAAYQGSQA